MRELNTSLTFVLCNARSICNKLSELSDFVNLSLPDIICISETWLNTAYSSSVLGLKNYAIYRKDRLNRGGGVLLAIKNNLVSNEVMFSSDSEIIAVNLTIASTVLRVIASYRPPSTSSDSKNFPRRYIQTN